MARIPWEVIGLALTVMGSGGCRVHPVSLAMTLAGDVIDAAELQELEPKMIGEPAAAANDVFGERNDTLVDLEDGGAWLVFEERNQHFAETYYVVEASAEGIITNLFKAKRNIDGLEDLQKIKQLTALTVGADRAECERACNFDEPLHAMYSLATGYDVYFYNSRNLTHTRGYRYCLLCFDPQGRCWEVRMLGVTAD
jgi:hypothetical protein